jgi:hypothetical protein
MYIEDELEKIVYNTFLSQGLAVKRSLVTAIVDDLVDHMFDEGYMQVIEVRIDD